MKIKDIERTANVAWSPKTHTPIYLTAGTAAQQLDASFNTNAALEIYSLNLSEPGPDMLQVATIPSEQRFHKVIWGSGGSSDAGTIIGGCDGGIIQIYNASKILKGENGLVSKPNKHTGPVHALDFNAFQPNLFATGASESEIFIWDLNNTTTAMTPGAKSQPLEDVLSISWNCQVQHILASTFASKCVIWDLRKNEPIIKLTDTVSRVRWKVVAWHPEVATQLCLASEEDHSPIIQLWDLRFATSPLKTMESHQRGVLSIAWCRADSDLLVSVSKDNRILAWNPNTDQQSGEVLSEVAKTNQWSFDVQWCPKNPALIACPSFDGHVHVYSLMGGKTQQVQTTNKIADSFPGMDGYAQAPVQQDNIQQVCNDLSKPPKWLKRPVGATFGFGGKLISFDSDCKSVQISQVITEPELVEKSTVLEQALENGNFVDYCRVKADQTDDQHKKYVWHFIRANFEVNPRTELLNLLGYKIEDVNQKLVEVTSKKNDLKSKSLSENLKNLDPFESITANPPKKEFAIKTGDDIEGLITQALLLGNVEAAVDLCLQAKRFADAIIIAMTGGSDLLAKTQHAYLEQCEGYVSSLISALVSEDWTSIITNCELNSWKEAFAATLTHASDDVLPGLIEQLGNRLLQEGNNDTLKLDSQLCYICAGSFDCLVHSWSEKSLGATDDLQELVELVVFLQKSIERQGRQVTIQGGLAELLIQYSSILASQGHLNTALTYLGSSQNEKVSELRDRLYISLGQKPLYMQPQPQPTSSRRQSQRHSFSNSFQPPSNPWQAQPVRTLSPAPLPIRPPSVGVASSSTPSTGLPSRKYILDPSVTSNPYGVPSAGASTWGGYSNATTNNNFGAVQSGNNNIAPNSILNPMPQVAPPYGEVASERIFQTKPVPSGWNDPPAFSKSLKSQYGGSVMSAVHAGTKLWQHGRVSVSTGHKVPQETALPAPPITHPIYGSAPSQTDYPNNNGFQHSYNNPPTSGGFERNQLPPKIFQPQAISAQIPPPIAGNGFNSDAFKQNAIGYSSGQVSQTTASPQQIIQERIVESVQKLPIPEEHIHMQTVLDELKYQCICAANNPQTKRKLDDVGRKLEALYDLLREQRLSPNTLTSLHQLVQLVQNGDYTRGLGLHTQLVSGPDFAQIANFMPGLKVLLQCALQLQVFIR